MSQLTIQEIGLRPAQLRAVERKARHLGQSASQYVRGLIERDLLAGRSFDEILRPVRDDVARAGVTESQLDRIVDRARGAGPRKKRAR